MQEKCTSRERRDSIWDACLVRELGFDSSGGRDTETPSGGAGDER